MYKPLVKNVIFPITEFLCGRKTVSNLSDLEKSQWLAPAELKEIQLVKLKQLINHAYNNSLFYKRRFDEIGILPSDIKGLGDIERLPFLTKEDVRLNLSAMVDNKNLRHCRIISTGGSTGVPLRLYMDERRRGYDFACMMRFQRWWGHDIGDKQAIIWGWPNEFVLPGVKKILYNRIYLSAFELSHDSMERFYRKLLKFKPSLIWGYATAVYTFSKFLKEKQLNAGALKIKTIIATGDVLYGYVRAFISSVFNCPVANHYAARDGGVIAGECRQGNMHIHAENVIVESVERELVITHLENYAMPFIRYRIGDLGVLGNGLCPCGRGLLLLESLQGRANDVLVAPSGKSVHSLSLVYIMRDIKNIKKFKVIQEEKDKLVIKVVKEPGFADIDTGYIVSKIKNLMGNGVNIFFETVDEIPDEPSRKFKWVISNVKEDNN